MFYKSSPILNFKRVLENNVSQQSIDLNPKLMKVDEIIFMQQMRRSANSAPLNNFDVKHIKSRHINQ